MSVSGNAPLVVRRSRALRPPPARIFTTETVIRPQTASFAEQLRELWTYRHLCTALVWRNVRVEFDALRLGAAWATMRPLLFAVVFAMFRSLSNADTRTELPYLLHVYSGLLLWTYFTDAATNSAGAIRVDLPLLKKVYYPRLLTPLVPAISGLLTLLVGLAPLAFMMVWEGVAPGWQLLLLPAAILPCVILALGLGMLVSALSVESRDWERALAFVLTVGLWLSPVIYSPELIPSAVRSVFHLNPMTGALEAFRAALFAGIPFPLGDWAYALVSSAVVLGLGIWSFRHTELRLVDRL